MKKEKMTDKQMDSLLVDLYQSKYWEALKRFMDNEHDKVIATLCVTDVINNPSEALKCQGIRSGLNSIVKYIEDEVERRTEDNKEKTKNKYTTPDYNGF